MSDISGTSTSAVFPISRVLLIDSMYTAVFPEPVTPWSSIVCFSPASTLLVILSTAFFCSSLSANSFLLGSFRPKYGVRCSSFKNSEAAPISISFFTAALSSMLSGASPFSSVSIVRSLFFAFNAPFFA